MENKNSGSPLVSVIIPAYNAGKLLSGTIQSLLDQQYAFLEIIIVNDGSSDNTEQIVKTYTFDSRIKYIFQENKGCSGAKNTGMAVATGDFIQYLDADDVLSPDKISEQVHALQDRADEIAVCRTKAFFGDIHEPGMSEIDTDFLYNTDNTFEFLLNLYGINGNDGMIQPNAFLISRKLAESIGPWDTSLSPSPDEDGEYFCRALLAAKGLLFTTGGVNYYRKHPSTESSLSRQVSHRHAKGALRSLQLIKNQLLSRENSSRVKELMAQRFANFIYLYSFYKDLGRAAKNEIHELGITKVPETGGGNFKRLARWVGFDNALRFKNLLSRKWRK
ncbi:MAG TPA: glycosyltransferase family 2 protein [Puia sp.]|nr:glycosyltransferase family 2 protein [Puia sp.]